MRITMLHTRNKTIYPHKAFRLLWEKTLTSNPTDKCEIAALQEQ